MMDINTLKQIILDFQSRPLPRLTQRDLQLAFIRDMSLCVVGARRAGKTYRTYQFMQEHLAQGGTRETICRVQFNDHRLSGLPGSALSLIDEAYYTMFPEKRRKDDVLFVFDEIHRVQGWEDYVLYLLDEPTHRVLITGSTSRLLAGDIASGLRGKNFCRVLYPFSFGEFARHYDVDPDIISSALMVSPVNCTTEVSVIPSSMSCVLLSTTMRCRKVWSTCFLSSAAGRQ